MQGPLILDRYRPLDTAGEGGSGIVQICWDASLQRRVAIKRMPVTSKGSGVPGLGEARTGAMLKHPNIVSVIDFAVAGGEAYLIMEAIEGVSLRELIRKSPSGADLDIVAAVANATAEALDFAHDNQVLHLDIKPENILVDKSGRIKVSDFGISELADAQGFGAAGGGTIGYMPPEQICGEDLDQRCDEFALAVVVYELLCGSNPFAARTLDRTLQLMEAGDFTLPSDVRDDVDPALDDVLAAALSPVRSERYETIYDFAVALLPLLGNARAGYAKLRELSRDDLPEAAAPVSEAEGLWDRVPERARLVSGRAIAALLSWWLASVGLVGMGLLDTPACLGLSVIAAALAVAAPSAGALVSIALCGIAMICNPALPALLGIGLTVAAAGWWLSAGRGSTAAANTLLLTAPLGLVGLAPLAPMIAGFTCTAGRSIVTGLMQGLLALSLAICTDAGDILHFGATMLAGPDATASWALAARPDIWVGVASLALCAFCVSALCSRATRVSSIFGAISGAAVLAACQLLAHWLQEGSWGMFDMRWAVAILLSCAAVVVIGALGAPYRDEGED